jgi:hypothetical protein
MLKIIIEICVGVGHRCRTSCQRDRRTSCFGFFAGSRSRMNGHAIIILVVYTQRRSEFNFEVLGGCLTYSNLYRWTRVKMEGHSIVNLCSSRCVNNASMDLWPMITFKTALDTSPAMIGHSATSPRASCSSPSLGFCDTRTLFTSCILSPACNFGALNPSVNPSSSKLKVTPG